MGKIYSAQDHTYKTLVRKSYGEVPVKRPGIKLRDNTKLILRE